MMPTRDGTTADGALDRMDMIESVTIGIRLEVMQMLDERTARVHTHELHAKADTKDRQFWLCIECAKQRELRGLPRWLHHLRFRVKCDAKGANIDVITARDHDAIAALQQRRAGLGDRGQKEGNAARSNDRIEIALLHFMSQSSLWIANEIGGDADDRRVHPTIMVDHRPPHPPIIGLGQNHWAMA
jgi:hypothetical protein